MKGTVYTRIPVGVKGGSLSSLRAKIKTNPNLSSLGAKTNPEIEAHRIVGHYQTTTPFMGKTVLEESNRSGTYECDD